VERLIGGAVFDLAAVGRYRLGNPPLAQALAEIRYPTRASLQTLDGVVDLQNALTELFPYMNQQQVQQVSLLVGPGMAPASNTQTERTWRFTDDAGWALVVAASVASLSIGPDYGDFEEFRTRFAAAIEALHETAALPRCDRLGLRYVDIAQMPPGDPQAWREWFRPELIGWSGGSVVGGHTSVVTSITQTQLTTSPAGDLAGLPYDVQAIVRHGYVPPNTVVPGVAHEPIENPAFLLDMDLFIEGHQSFDGGELARQVTLLHDQIDRFFRWSLTHEGEQHFALEEIA
jgi:uncharacterized protein (TIGR04255 family)